LYTITITGIMTIIISSTTSTSIIITHKGQIMFGCLCTN
jgi:hypothetical protein